MAGKPVTQTRDRIAHAVIDSVSKHGLIDLVVDLLRQNAGDEHLDGASLAGAFAKAYAPIAAARGEKTPNPSAIEMRITRKLRNQRAFERSQLRELSAAPKGSPAE